MRSRIHPGIPFDSEMKESDKRLFIGKSDSHKPSALHIPSKDNLDVAICTRSITEIITPKKYGAYCLNCKRIHYSI